MHLLEKARCADIFQGLAIVCLITYLNACQGQFLAVSQVVGCVNVVAVTEQNV